MACRCGRFPLPRRSPSVCSKRSSATTSKLPGGIFSRAFVRACKEVGLDPDQTIRDFVSEFSAEEAESVPITPPIAVPVPSRASEASRRAAKPAAAEPVRRTRPSVEIVPDESEFKSAAHGHRRPASADGERPARARHPISVSARTGRGRQYRGVTTGSRDGAAAAGASGSRGHAAGAATAGREPAPGVAARRRFCPHHRISRRSSSGRAPCWVCSPLMAVHRSQEKCRRANAWFARSGRGRIEGWRRRGMRVRAERPASPSRSAVRAGPHDQDHSTERGGVASS